MSKVKKHREFFMNKYTMECRFEKVNDDDIHVIEYAAFEHVATKCEEAQSELLSCRKELEELKAKLMFIEPIAKELCKHVAYLKYSPYGEGCYPNYAICEKCGTELKATWSEK